MADVVASGETVETVQTIVLQASARQLLGYAMLERPRTATNNPRVILRLPYPLEPFPTLSPRKQQRLRSAQEVSHRTAHAVTKEAAKTRATFARLVHAAASTATVARLPTTVLPRYVKIPLGNVILPPDVEACLQTVLAGMLAMAKTMATSARPKCAAASMAIAVLQTTTARLRRVVNRPSAPASGWSHLHQA